MSKFAVVEKSDNRLVRIKVIGVGGGGTNLVNKIAEHKDILPITLIASNTDTQHLQTSRADIAIQLGSELTRGLGAGMNPDTGRESALESEKKIREVLSDSDIVFVAAGLGGGTGTGAAPVIAKIAKELGALTIAIVTTPFTYEGRKRAKFATLGLEEIQQNCNSIVVIPNSKLSSIIDRNTSYIDAFKIVDSILFRAVNGICGIILSTGRGNINLDFEDMRTVMQNGGKALMGIGEADGDSAAIRALKIAIESPLLEDTRLDGASGALVHFHFHPSYPLSEIEEAMEYVNEKIEDMADVMFGTSPDENIENGLMKVTIIATGFDRKEEIQKRESILETDIQKNENISHLRENTETQETNVDENNSQESSVVDLSIDDILKNIDQASQGDIESLDTPTIYRKNKLND